MNTKLFKKVKGGVTAPNGFKAGSGIAGLKKSGNPDIGIIYSQATCSASGVFTTNAVKASCVTYNQSLLPSNSINAICCNSGNANACTGIQGEKDVVTMAKNTANNLGCNEDSVLIASTGIIGEFLPMDKVTLGIKKTAENISANGGDNFSNAILTTDKVNKQYAISVELSGGTVIIGGCAKGSGMIHPNMATMLGFITTDTNIKSDKMQKILKRVVDKTFNNLTVDGDTSTNDMVLMLANGLSAVSVNNKTDSEIFESALFEVCNNLCAQIASDGEGATKHIEINVKGGKSYADCKLAAKSIANSNLVKTAMFGNDPNWGRILCAIGYSGAQISSKKIKVDLCGIPVCEALRPINFDHKKMIKALKKQVISIDVNLGFSTKYSAIAHTCDFSYDYVKINAEYHT